MWGSQPCLCPPQTSLTDSWWPSSLTLLLWPLMRRVLVPSAQLTYQSVPAVVPTTPMSMLSWKTALTMAPSRVSSRSRNTELDLGGSRGSRVVAMRAQGAWCFWGASTFLSSGLTQACPPRGQAQLARVLAYSPGQGSPGSGALAPQLWHGSHGPQAQAPGVAATDQPRPRAQQHS